MVELVLVAGPCCIGKSWYIEKHFQAMSHVTHDMHEPLHRPCKQAASHLSAGRSVAFESGALLDKKTRDEVVAFVRHKMTGSIASSVDVKTIWITTALAESEQLACLWFFGKEVYAAHAAGRDVRNAPVGHSGGRLIAVPEGGETLVRHNIDASWQTSVAAPGRPCLFLGIHEAMHFSPQQKTLFVKPAVMRLLLNWFAEPGRVAAFVHIGTSSSGSRYTVKALAAAWHKLCLPVECHLFLSGLALDASDEEGEVAPVPMDAASLSLLHSLTQSHLAASLALGSFDDGSLLLWRSFGVRCAAVEDNDTLLSLMRASGSQPRHDVDHAGTVGPNAWQVRRLSHKLAYWHTANQTSEEGSPAVALCVSLANVLEAYGAEPVAIGGKYVENGLVRVTPEDVLLVSRSRSALAVSVKCCSSSTSKVNQVDVGALMGKILFAYCSCETSIDSSNGLSRCRHVVAVFVALSRISVDLVPDVVSGTEALAAVDQKRQERGIRYEPQLTEVDDVGLPLHMHHAPKATRRAQHAAPARVPRAAGPNAPVRPLTPFFYFCNKRRAELFREQPELRMTEAAKQLGKEWREMAQDVKEKILAECAADSIRYETEWKAYIETEEYKTLQLQTVTCQPRQKQARTEEKFDEADGELAEPLTSVEQFEVLNKEWRTDGGRWVCEWDDDAEAVPVPPPQTRAKLASVFADLSDDDGECEGGGFGARGSTKLLETQGASSVKLSKSHLL